MLIDKPLHKNLKKAREAKGFSQGYVAEQLNITRQAISKWENGKTYPDIDNLILLSKLYEVSLDALLTSSHASSSSKKNTQEDRIEIILLAVIISLSCLFPFTGIIVSLGVLFWMSKNKSYKIIRIFCIICICISYS